MASKQVLTQAFFDQFTSFSTELCEMYPDDADFSMFATTLKLMKMTNPALIIKYVRDNVLQFEDKIMKKDESFFLDYNFAEYADAVDMNIFQKLRQYIASMSSSSKNSVWTYIQNIVRLAKALK
uniref:Uncharacterized protein n=1 Tax=viral metagenome TaxID=1070528 RepID=A0A6C0F097_9ZZZZ